MAPNKKKSTVMIEVNVDSAQAKTNRLYRYNILRSKQMKKNINKPLISENTRCNVQPIRAPKIVKTHCHEILMSSNINKEENVKTVVTQKSQKSGSDTLAQHFRSQILLPGSTTSSSLNLQHSCTDRLQCPFEHRGINLDASNRPSIVDREEQIPMNISTTLHLLPGSTASSSFNPQYSCTDRPSIVDRAEQIPMNISTNLNLLPVSTTSSSFNPQYSCTDHFQYPFNSGGINFDGSNRPTIVDPAEQIPLNIPTTLHLRRYHDTSSFGGPDILCHFCGARMWSGESVTVTPKVDYPVFSLCCKQGMICLPPPSPTPPFLDHLLDPASGSSHQHFKDNIRVYNSLFQFTSLGGKIDNNINNGRGPYIFRLNGQTHHRLGSLLPLPGQSARYAQLYIYDTSNEISNRIAAVCGASDVPSINKIIVEGILVMLNECNEIAKAFRMARDRFEGDEHTPMRLRLISAREPSKKNYAAPCASEIAALIVGDIGVGTVDRDIIIEHMSEGLKRISFLHPLYMAMQYPLLFPYGEDGYVVGIPFVWSPVKEKLKRKTVSMREYYAYQIQTRSLLHNTLLRGSRLFQQFITDAFSATEEDRLLYIRNNQKKLRADMYKDVRDAMQKGDVRGVSVGKRVILPASFTGSSRYLFQNYQDALAICRYYGFPDLFITFTCNANWVEIQEAVQLIHGQRAEDRPDIVARIFKLKLAQLLDDLMKENHFGKALAVTYTIEFQKRGLPHVHILLWLHPCAKFKTAADIDKFVSAEIPDELIDPVGYEAVTSFMMHGPCGPTNYNAPCMIDNKCTKFFPKKLQSETTIDDHGYVLYRRRDTRNFCCRSNVRLDNSFVVPHNVDLVVRYRSHINVEVCNQTKAIKYLFKYINKGPDRARVVIERDLNKENDEQQLQEQDEIKSYLDCRYLSAYEAAWRLFMFRIHHREPAVLRLPIHLPDQHNIYFDDNEPLQKVLSRPNIERTMFTEWMVANERYESARELLYADFPTKWVWHKDKMEWRPRANGKCIGRIIYINPTAGELYYLRLLVNVVKGARNHEEMRTVNGVVYSTFQAACDALGLLGDDKEWNEALLQASNWATSKQLRDLFVTIVLFCEVANPEELFEGNWRIMSDDIERRFKKALNVERFSMPDNDLRNYVLIALEELLVKNCSSLAEKKLPQPNENNITSSDNRLIFEELNYDIRELHNEHLHMLSSLNHEQSNVYSVIKQSVDLNEGRMFFVNGHGGTGKTYLWKTIIAGVRSLRKIVLAVASSGIASLLLPGGRTAHSRFKIPITIDEYSTCEIKKKTQLAALLKQTSLIIWDEAPMVHKFCVDALDRTLRDICSDSTTNPAHKPFGGKTVVFGGDFRQILPVIPSGSKADILNATICNSKLWQQCEMYTLKSNMRLLQPQLDDHSRDELTWFANWLLEIGEGKISPVMTNDSADGDFIAIPDEFLIQNEGDPFKLIFEGVYIDFHKNFAEPLYIQQRAIVTPHNNTVDQLNDYILEMIPGPVNTYRSCDTLSKSSIGFSSQDILYPPEVLNIITFPGVPNHILNLKIGVVVMLLRNISQVNGLCNGTRLLVTQLATNIIEAKIITGEHLGEKVFIPKILFTVKNKKWPFVLNRKQFPLRLSYAMTINKSQGQTLDVVGIYLPRPIFTHGQLYVALSRARQIAEVKLSQLRPGIRAFIVVRIVRLWDTILPPHNEFTGIDFLAVDDQKNAMHGMISLDYVEDFQGRLEEGGLYKIKMFQVSECKKSHNAVPLRNILSFNSSTQIEELHENIDKYPRYYFKFSTMEDILKRSEKEYFMTDVIGILTAVAPVRNMQVSPKQTATNITGQTSSQQWRANKQDIFIKLLSGDTLRISLWENILPQFNIDALLQQPTKPIIVIAGTTVKTIMGQKGLSTSSATKIYINLDIPEAAALRERYHDETSTIEMMPSQVVRSQTHEQEMKIEELYYLNAKDIKGQRFRVTAKINKINMRRGWFYKSCSTCTFRVDNVGDSFICSEHGRTTPTLVMRLNLVLEDETAKLDAVIFGALAEKLTNFQLTSSAISKGIQIDQLPPELQAIVNEEYVFTLGLSDQASEQFLLKYKVFGFNKIESKATTELIPGGQKNKDDTILTPVSPTSQDIPDDIFSDESPAKKLKPSARRTLDM